MIFRDLPSDTGWRPAAAEREGPCDCPPRQSDVRKGETQLLLCCEQEHRIHGGLSPIERRPMGTDGSFSGCVSEGNPVQLSSRPRAQKRPSHRFCLLDSPFRQGTLSGPFTPGLSSNYLPESVRRSAYLFTGSQVVKLTCCPNKRIRGLNFR